ncbi:hypothetical protein PFMC_06032, partial [Plasmodium falciparum CAMP/Malaysia]
CLQNGTKTKCTEKCKRDCGCFKRWVEQKQTEWKPIKEHFGNQEDFKNKRENSGSDMLSGIMDSADVVLELLLEKDVLLESLQEAYGDVKELEGIKNMLKEDETERKAEEAVAGILAGVENNTTIDKLLQHELKEAEDCLPKQNECDEPKAEGGARILQPSARDNPDVQQPPKDEDSEEDDDDEDDDEETAEDPKDQEEVKDTTDGTEGSPASQEPPAATTPPEVKPCDIVKTLFEKPEDFTDACTLKYGPKAPTSWKCIPTTSGEKSGKDGATGGSICVPPRRRKLYVGKLEEWVNSGKTETSVSPGGAASSTSTPESSQLLRDAFIQSAAVETFFLWDRYKKQKEKKPQGVGSLLQPMLNGSLESDSDDPEKQLKEGKIPNDFLRQMFYTFADYKDILFSGIKDEKSGYSDIITGDKEIQKRESNIKEKITKFFEQNGNKEAAPRGSPQTQPSEKLKSWWSQNGEHIWNAMVCALTYEHKGEKGEKHTLKQNNEVKQALLDNDGNKPQNNYQYSSVKLKDESGAKSSNAQTTSPSGDTPTTLNNPKLTEFVERPPYFRYLEEWGQNFCKERKKRLEKIKGDCTQGDDKCSGDGENCKTILTQDYSTVSNLECPRCAKSCGFYKKWIEKKKEEFTKQSNAYDKQKTDATTKSDDTSDNGFRETLDTCSKAKDFLQKLGSCSKNNNTKEDKTDFDEYKAFKHTDYCDPCPVIGVKCKNGVCSGTNVKCKHKRTITANDIKNEGNFTEPVDMLVSDNGATGFEVLEACKGKGIFEGIKEDKWKCGTVCGVDICYLKGDNQKNHDKKNILIRALFKRWLENFLKDYNKINDKISQCMKNREGSTCINQCENICECVGIWINKKNEEWKNIKKRFFKQYDVAVSEEVYTVRSFLQQEPFYNDVEKVKGNFESLEELEKTLKCNGSDKSQNGTQKDIIECLLGNLKDKIETCPSSTSGSEQCTTPPSTLDNDYPDNDHDIQKPAFCPAEDIPEKSKVPQSEDDSTKSSESPKKGDLPSEDKLKICPYDNDTCNYYEKNKKRVCPQKIHHMDLNHWTMRFLKYDKDKSEDMNDGIFVPPRRRQLCSRNIRTFHGRIDSEQKFREYFLADPYNEAKQLSRYYGTDHKQILEEMKYSFADYGDIIKGDDKLGDGLSEIMQKILDKLKKKETHLENLTLQKLWDENKKHIWYAMLCGYKAEKGNFEKSDCSLPDDKAPQFLRWFQQWGKTFCTTKKELKEQVKIQCGKATCKSDGTIEDKCKIACKNYSNFISGKQN